MRLVVGLGNPGRRYRNTWHNLGASVVEQLAARWGTSFKPGRGRYYLAESRSTGRHITLMIPTSFMNLSGDSVYGWSRYHKVPPQDILIVYDDHDLPLGRIRIRDSGSSGGHRGMESIILHLHTDAVPRLRIGIRTGTEREELRDQVLSRIPRIARDRVDKIVQISATAVEDILHRDMITAMTEYNGMDLYRE